MVETTGGAKGRNGLAVWALAAAVSVNALTAKKEFIKVFMFVISWVKVCFPLGGRTAKSRRAEAAYTV
jgi:hypothetical protein